MRVGQYWRPKDAFDSTFHVCICTHKLDRVLFHLDHQQQYKYPIIFVFYSSLDYVAYFWTPFVQVSRYSYQLKETCRKKVWISAIENASNVICTCFCVNRYLVESINFSNTNTNMPITMEPTQSSRCWCRLKVKKTISLNEMKGWSSMSRTRLIY